ncbi:AI-2E family transporter [Natronomonas sp. LN261]|jgi:predicted PurR-regulated permease PerM|uniref:AI-2E family transporter n=1 Tax=Natronomonas sp. LN261 TaxID=2750669 RepID=UPI0015EFCD8C|nr:AI-2E family transporter [Natronomonas sp. LN261]
MNERRLVVAGFGALVTAAVGYLAYRFIAAITVAIFLYYSTRRFYVSLGRFRLPKRVRAMITISMLAVPLIVLLSYTLVLLVVEARLFVETYPVFETIPDDVAWFEGLEDLPEPTIVGIMEAYRGGELDVFIDFAVEHAAFVTSLITGLLLNLLIVVILTYYLLIDGATFRSWLLRFDDGGIVREYLEAADDELEAVLFGNLLNVIVISIVAIVVFTGYNAFAPAAAEVPYPALAGALTGIASLIPVVGMKIVYGPIAAIAAVPVVLGGDPALLSYVVGFVVLAVVIVDTIPDLVLRPYFSGKRTHVGLLMLAYIFGPVVFGFYGLFFAPIVLVLGLTFADTALPRLLGADRKPEGPPDGQTTLEEFR